MRIKITIIFLCLIFKSNGYSQEIYFDSIDRVLFIPLADNCIFNSEFSLTFTDNYSYNISENSELLFFLSINRLYWNYPFEYEVFIKVFKCPEGFFTYNERFKILSKKALQISLNESKLLISDKESNLILDLTSVTNDIVIEFKKQLKLKFD